MRVCSTALVGDVHGRRKTVHLMRQPREGSRCKHSACMCCKGMGTRTQLARTCLAGSSGPGRCGGTTEGRRAAVGTDTAERDSRALTFREILRPSLLAATSTQRSATQHTHGDLTLDAHWADYVQLIDDAHVTPAAPSLDLKHGQKHALKSLWGTHSVLHARAVVPTALAGALNVAAHCMLPSACCFGVVADAFVAARSGPRLTGAN